MNAASRIRLTGFPTDLLDRRADVPPLRRKRPTLVLAGGLLSMMLAAGTVPVWSEMSPQLQMQATQLAAEHAWGALAALARRASKADPSDGFAWYLLGTAEQGLGNGSGATGDLKKADRFAPPSLRPTIEMLLAQHYAAQGDQPALTAVYRELRQDDPSAASDVLQQDGGQLRSSARSSHISIPDVSPRSLAELTALVRSRWERDAVPILATVTDANGPCSASVDYYSASTQRGLVASMPQTSGALTPIDHPDFGTRTIPAEFLSVGRAIAVAGRQGATGRLNQAFLHYSAYSTGAARLVWDLSFGAHFQPFRVRAAALSSAGLARLELAARRGERLAQYRLALVDATGIAGSVDSAQAIYWLRKAALQGSLHAENKLGQFMQYGVGIAADPARAAFWYKRAAAAGFGPAQFNLALLYETGRGVSQSWFKAAQWLKLAARAGVRQADTELLFVQRPVVRAAHQRQLISNQDHRCPVGFVGYQPNCVLFVDPSVRDVFSLPPP